MSNDSSTTSPLPKTVWIKTGDFFFKYRNAVFPLILITLFVSFKPTHNSFPGPLSSVNTDWIAVALTASGLLCRAIVIGFAIIKHGGLNKRVYADRLLTTGMFGNCRNSLYVGNMLIYAGIFLLHGNPYVVVIGTTVFFAIYNSIIAAEEYFLAGEFGAAYTEYCRDVPRWLPKIGRFADAIKDMTFSFKRILIKDYSPNANALITFIALIVYKTWHYGTAEDFHQELKFSALLIGLILATAGLISMAKKRRILSL